ncbi:MAG: carbamate kinase [Candidatus Aenigmarchaeota archaeon]|nr:carbamate kinase [Candidatus Aenigmarchaeota archaeon]
MRLAAVALGGNSLIRPKERGTAKSQIVRIDKTVSYLKPLIRKFSLVLTHGNAPQAGALLIQQEKTKRILPQMSLDTLDAMTQGELGYWIQQSVENILKKNAVTVVTRVLVKKSDSAFSHPTKPIGPYYKRKTFKGMIKEPEGWRRVVPSPKPVKIIDIKEIESLVRRNFVVIACGGGGVPVIEKNNRFVGVEAVIDKDYATQKLASQLKAETVIFLTDVDYVYCNYGKPNKKPLRRLTVKEAINYLKENQFGEGSMKPKIEASVEFLKRGGKRVLITSPEKLNLALKGKTGTVIE